MGKVLGEGAYGTVNMASYQVCAHAHTHVVAHACAQGKQVAIKRMKAELLKPQVRDVLERG
jgi:hypothetical protein